MSDESRHNFKKKRRSRPVTPARKVAFDVLMAVDEDDAFANLLLPSRIHTARLNPSDASLATELTYGTLRMRGFYDAVISNAAARDIESIDVTVLNILRLGVHQLLNMRVAQHAAVDESVNLAEHVASLGAIGFVNAVLRRVSRHDLADWQDFITKDIDQPEQKLSLVYSHPSWIVRAFKQVLSAESRENELSDLLNADNINPRVTLVDLSSSSENHDRREGTPTPYSPVGMTLDKGGDPMGLDRVRAGVVRVQDEGSQLAALALSRHHPITRGEKWLDMCAGPGGKAALLAAEAQTGGAQLIANEINPVRAALVSQSLRNFEKVEVRTGDGVDYGQLMPDTFDRIMLDAPCSGLGALRRRPEARWRKTPRDVGELGNVQSTLFESAIDSLKPGGTLAYVTCSPHIAETRAIIAGVLKKNPHVSELNAKEVINRVSVKPIDLAGDHLSAQLWPHRHQTDAMFISLFTKG